MSAREAANVQADEKALAGPVWQAVLSAWAFQGIGGHGVASFQCIEHIVDDVPVVVGAALPDMQVMS